MHLVDHFVSKYSAASNILLINSTFVVVLHHVGIMIMFYCVQSGVLHVFIVVSLLLPCMYTPCEGYPLLHYAVCY